MSKRVVNDWARAKRKPLSRLDQLVPVHYQRRRGKKEHHELWCSLCDHVGLAPHVFMRWVRRDYTIEKQLGIMMLFILEHQHDSPLHPLEMFKIVWRKPSQETIAKAEDALSQLLAERLLQSAGVGDE